MGKRGRKLFPNVNFSPFIGDEEINQVVSATSAPILDKKIAVGALGIITAFLFFFTVITSWAYLPIITILDKAEIAKLSDDKLTEAYIDVLVELEASKAFHTTSGFTPKQYESYKGLIRYRILLLQEIDKRKLTAPRGEDMIEK